MASEISRGEAAVERVRQEMVEFEKSFRLGLADLPGMSFSCPRCGSALILRTARKGRNRGSQFWGCDRVAVVRLHG
jgi:predicted RNA-binding Zn-ribbon protein involved in translation (DUF1610 family)